MLARYWRHERESLLQESEQAKHRSVEVLYGMMMRRKASFLTIRSTEEKWTRLRLVGEAGNLDWGRTLRSTVVTSGKR